MHRWSTLLVDSASVSDLGTLPAEHTLRHADAVAGQRLKPHELYQRWEQQQWSAEDVRLEQDRADLARLPRRSRDEFVWNVATFIVGEYTGLDLLAPILTGAGEADDVLFLSTQLADEARHSRVMFRIGAEVVGLDPEPERMLHQAWDLLSDGHRRLALEEAQLVQTVHGDPSDIEAWLRAVTVFHLVTEGVLALVGQRVVVGTLARGGFLAGTRAAFAAMCRDESRHVGYGQHAVRAGLAYGYAEAVYDALEQCVPTAFHLTAERARNQAQRAHILSMADHALRRSLTAVGADPVFVHHLLALAHRATTSTPDDAEARPATSTPTLLGALAS